MRIISFTIARDEPLFEPLWRRYYSQVGDIQVFNPIVTAGLSLELGSHDAEVKQIEFVRGMTEYYLMSGYDIVICPDVDEFLIPCTETLRDFCNTLHEDYARADGYNVVHQREIEDPCDPWDILKDRQICYRSPDYCKTILTRVPLHYSKGRHYVWRAGDWDFAAPVHPNLDLVHLKFVDFDRDFDRWMQKAARSTETCNFTREQFGDLYDTGIEHSHGWKYWHAELGSDLLPQHWRSALQVDNWWTGLSSRQDIPNLLDRMGAKRICEVGVRDGEHLKSLLIRNIDVAVAVDAWRETGIRSQNDICLSQPELDEQCRLVAAMDPRVSVHREFSVVAAAQKPDGYFDFVYLDADHTEGSMVADLNSWWPKVRSGGFLAGHDYGHATPTCPDGTFIRFGVVEAVNRFVARHGLKLHVDHESDWFIRKP